MTLREEVTEDGLSHDVRDSAHFSFTAYVSESADAPRPVTFVFNAGPGSSSAWLHLGLFGPRRVLMPEAGNPTALPYGLVQNDESALAVTDLVFIDPVSTGYSRAVEGESPTPFHEYKRDIESVAEFIRLWVTRQGRWLSPTFVAGESYGTLRAAALVESLQRRYGMYFNGLMLISSVLDLSSIQFEGQRNDRAHVLHLPTYTAIAHYRGKVNGKFDEVLADSEQFASADYAWALARGDRLTADQRGATIRSLSRLTGLSEDFVDRADLRVEPRQLAAELRRDRRSVVGGLDGRYSAPTPSALSDTVDEDPSLAVVSGRFAAAVNHYIHEELGYRTDLHYES